MAQHIGIAACSAEGAALCYRTICAEGALLLGPHGHPEITMHTPPFASYVAVLDRGDWPGVAELMLGSAAKLAGAGADFVICPDNTLHQALGDVLPRSPLPWLSIADVVAAQAATRGFRRAGVLGTRWLVGSQVYPAALTAHGVDYLLPDTAERERVHQIIMDELVYGTVIPESVSDLRQVITRMRAAGCDAVVLGCTELPLALDDASSPLPVLDSTRLLARAALRQAVTGPAQPAVRHLS
jgi:aspartate racemase